MTNELKWLEHSREFLRWVSSLTDVSENAWLIPMNTGKWSMAEVISHLITWDRYRLYDRLPQMKQGAMLTGIQPNTAQLMNEQASEYALSGIAKNQLIAELVAERTNLMSKIAAMTEADLQSTFTINTTLLSIGQFFDNFIAHDIHHRRQIDSYLALYDPSNSSQS